MNYTAIWSEFAEIQIDEIYRYYAEKASHKVALNIIKEILNAPNILTREPKVGQLEELLRNRKTSYRSLIFKNYKIIYSVNEKHKQVRIADVFDTRQNPIKINRKK